ncbi:MAG: DUF2911 domain-containing protein [Psychroflexus sp.]|nr:DUF2911 domain-containing protein [Psychroflexus sp.]MDR9448270.1 DUF2911 domain-containing protein [Psychroflexus sp.]
MNKLGLLLLILITTSLSTKAQDFNDLDKSPMDAIIVRADDNAPLVRIIYSRPKKRGREIFGELVPYNKVWRTGANESSEITFYQPMFLGDQHIDKGTYTLYTIPHKNNWTIIINEAVNTWGAYNYDPALDVARHKVEAKSTPATVENFSMAFRQADNGVDLVVGWDQTFVEVPFKLSNDN